MFGRRDKNRDGTTAEIVAMTVPGDRDKAGKRKRLSGDGKSPPNSKTRPSDGRGAGASAAANPRSANTVARDEVVVSLPTADHLDGDGISAAWAHADEPGSGGKMAGAGLRQVSETDRTAPPPARRLGGAYGPLEDDEDSDIMIIDLAAEGETEIEQPGAVEPAGEPDGPAQAEMKPVKFGRRRTDRIAEAMHSAARSTNSQDVADGATDRVAQPDEVARMTHVNRAGVERAKRIVRPLLMEVIDVTTAARLPRGELAHQINDAITEILAQQKLQLNLFEQRDLVTLLINDMLGLGPIEPLIEDETISEVMVNGPKKIYIERDGKLLLTDVTFHDNAHVMNVATRIVTGVGRRVDESNPICDARLKDGSRVNVIVPPLAIDGPTITIRKFKKDKLTLDKLVDFGAVSVPCARLLRVVSTSQCNILISGGTGSGKTTLLNCLTAFIEESERIITCEDAAELQLQQPHVVRLETRPPNLEGIGQVTMRDLVRNCLRMRPERIIVGEVRGPEAFDLLQAMNTGHDGSMGTIHANSPREAISRVENMIAMGGFNMAPKSVREQIASAVTVIIQAQRLRDGSRRITHITELLGMEGDTVTMQDLFTYEILGEDKNGKIIGQHKATGLRPGFWDRSRYFGLADLLAEALDERHAA
jgi:pilus assembly protein CpaF